MPAVHLFTYGSLMFEPVWTRVVGGHYRSSTAQIYGYKRWCIKGDSYPVVTPCYSSTPLQGVLYYNVDTRDLNHLDRFEGDYYYRQSVLAHVDDAPVVAQVYALKPKYRHLVEYKPWQPKRFNRVQLRAFVRRYCAKV